MSGYNSDQDAFMDSLSIKGPLKKIGFALLLPFLIIAAAIAAAYLVIVFCQHDDSESNFDPLRN